MTDKPRRLATYVHVGGKRYGPEDEIPSEVAQKITNPKAWADVDPPSSGVQGEAGQRRSGPRLAGYVHVGGRRYGPDDPIPPDVAARITNPRAWEGGKLPRIATGGVVRGSESKGSDTVLSQVSGGFMLRPEQVAAMAADDGDQTQQDPTEDQQKQSPARIPAPPRTGAGSGVDAWSAYAATQGVEVEDGARRDDIIAACERAGVLNEQ
ncbi:hypothetical protein [Micromonospora arborensis]|uniref:hypothetical protein n=1 Tax=Micromonospora arborensis TaxID=2116518 RepID=UPI0037120EC3